MSGRPPPPCAKCRQAGAGEGDSWCVGCRALEKGQQLLQQRWWSAGHRKVGEEVLVQAVRQIAALRGLDCQLQSLNDSWAAKVKKASGAGRSSGSLRPPSPPRAPPRHEGQRKVKQEVSEEHPRADRVHLQAARPSEEQYSYEEGSESEEEVESDKREEAKRLGLKSGVQPPSARSPRQARDRARSRSLERRKEVRKRPGHRGGAKHRRKFRSLENPGHLHHQRLSSVDLRIRGHSNRGVLDSEL